MLTAQGKRRDFSELPQEIVHALEEFLGERILRARTIHGGFSPGIAAVLSGDRGGIWFLKAASTEVNAQAPAFHRREAIITARLSEIPDLPVPKLLWSLDREPWVVLLFSYVSGVPPQLPWQEEDIRMVVRSLSELAQRLTPAPIDAPLLATDSGITRNFWRVYMESPNGELDDWTMRHLEELALLNDQAPVAFAGNTLLQTDLRSDNLIIGDDRVWVVDWPHATIGAPWMDPLAMAPSVEMQGGPEAEEFFSMFAFDVDPHLVNVAIATLASYFTIQALEPEPSELPGLRAFQAAQGDVARKWLAQRTGWK